MNDLILEPAFGYDHQIGLLVAKMNSCRKLLIGQTHDLDVPILDFQVKEGFNTIGTLLMHIAAMELVQQRQTLQQNLEQDEYELFGEAITGRINTDRYRGKNSEHYLSLLSRVRTQSLDLLKSKPDKWLFEEVQIRNRRYNNYFLWYHLIEDENAHFGQIKLIKKFSKPT